MRSELNPRRGVNFTPNVEMKPNQLTYEQVKEYLINFKADKLGWYLNRSGDYVEVIRILKINDKRKVIGIVVNTNDDGTQDEECRSYYIDGRYDLDLEFHGHNLVFYLGPDKEGNK